MAAADMDWAPISSPPGQDYSCDGTDHREAVAALVMVAVVAMFLLHVLGSLRRCSSNSLLHAVVMGVYTLSYPLVGYTIGKMQSTNWYVNDFTVWAVFLLLLLSGTDSLTACRLSDIDSWKSIYVKQLIKGSILVYIVLNYASMRMVSKSYLGKNAKVIADYMQNIDNKLVAFDPVTMEGCRYMVAGEKHCINKPDYLKVTTVQQIWQCEGNLLIGDRGKPLKDVCLYGTLQDAQPTKGPYLALCLPVIMVALCSWLTVACLLVKQHDDRYLKDPKLRSLMYRTIVITVVLAFLEAYQLYLYMASGWNKVALIRSYVTASFLQRRGSFLQIIIGLLLRLKSFRPWKRTLGQYCILQDLGHKSWARNCLHYATMRLVDKANKRPNKSVKLSENVKKAIVDSLLGCKGNLTNGVTSLQRNGVHAVLSWACDATATDGSVTRTILVWHIATNLCEQQLDKQAREEDALKTASTLSKYCMHLLAFAPNLLPDHSSISESILDESIDEARNLLEEAKGKNKKFEGRCEVLSKIISTDDCVGDETRLVAQGVHLARQLTGNIQEFTTRWKVLSDFWAEMMLYVSPSDDARAHLEALPKGGEFITHLWTLLTHAGVLTRGPAGANNV
ncbi:unnamed protein product [Urochloa decumbens]|uniref:DUF4220 domain-containing protein n=1 Tax=Urochloa decumbens TaxID=240449 RepID=A0ABC9B4T6_9POAL